jgi:hypothetical protein
MIMSDGLVQTYATLRKSLNKNVSLADYIGQLHVGPLSLPQSDERGKYQVP